MLFKRVCFSLCSIVSVLAQSETSSSPGTETTTADSTDATSSSGVMTPEYAIIGYEGCKAKEGMDPQKINGGFSEMITMIQGSLLGYYPKIDSNSGAAQDFWGPYSRNADYRSAIKGP